MADRRPNSPKSSAPITQRSTPGPGVAGSPPPALILQQTVRAAAPPPAGLSRAASPNPQPAQGGLIEAKPQSLIAICMPYSVLEQRAAIAQQARAPAVSGVQKAIEEVSKLSGARITVADSAPNTSKARTVGLTVLGFPAAVEKARQELLARSCAQVNSGPL